MHNQYSVDFSFSGAATTLRPGVATPPATCSMTEAGEDDSGAFLAHGPGGTLQGQLTA